MLRPRVPPLSASAALAFVAFTGTMMLGTSDAQTGEKNAEPVTVTAKLVEIPAKFPPDDLYDYAFVMKYEVMGGALDGKSIFVAHYKPRQPRSRIKGSMKKHVGGKLRSFVEGDKHKLKLSPDLKGIWKGALIDEYSVTDRKSTRYWCLQADKA